MRLGATRLGILQVGALALGALTLTFSAGSCGKVADGRPLYDSNTNWLVPCMADDQCTGSLRCYCGQCTKPCSQNGECSLLSEALCAESSEALCGESASAGGLCVKGCVTNADCGDRFGCSGGQCVPDPCSAGQCTTTNCGPGALQDWDSILRSASSDLNRIDADSIRFQRYIALGNDAELTDPGTGLCEPSLERKRQALTRLLNSLSLLPNIATSLPIDTGERIYRLDLRDYGWDRVLRIGSAEYADVWEALIANDPHAIPFLGDDAGALSSGTGTTVPVLLADPLIAAATRPEVYAAVLGLPPRLDTLLIEQLGIDLSSPDFQAGFVEERELLAQRWDLGVRIGYLWSIADVGRSPGSLFESPLLEPLGERELMFTLPNGLLAFAFAGADGQLQPSWSVSIDAREADRVARSPRSNWRRHPRLPAIRDQVRDYVAANPEQYGADLSAIQQRFPGPEELAALLESDANNLPRRSLLAAGLNPTDPDPIARVHEDFERPVTLQAAAALLLMPANDLVDNLNLLDPALSALDGGTVPRSVFTANFAATLCTLSTVLENRPDIAACP